MPDTPGGNCGTDCPYCGFHLPTSDALTDPDYTDETMAEHIGWWHA